MVKANKSYLTSTAWNVAEHFIADWQQNPFAWDQEEDVRSEIADRLRTAYQLIEYALVVGNYPKYSLDGYPQNYSRVSCNPAIQYGYKDGKRNTCRPDIVVWDDVKNPDRPRVEGYKWPVLWACELKLWYRGAPRPGNADEKKLRNLITQGRVREGCIIALTRSNPRANKCLDWRHVGKHPLWCCTASPPKKNAAG